MDHGFDVRIERCVMVFPSVNGRTNMSSSKFSCEDGWPWHRQRNPSHAAKLAASIARSVLAIANGSKDERKDVKDERKDDLYTVGRVNRVPRIAWYTLLAVEVVLLGIGRRPKARVVRSVD